MRYAEYCQQTKYLKMTIDVIKKMLDDKNIKYAYLVHDKDTLEDSSPKPEHLHVMMDFKGNSWTPEKLCKWFNDEPNRIEKPKTYKNRFVYENMCSYLIHETETSDGKYHYDEHDVIANFDFVEFINNIRNGVNERKANKRLHPIADILVKIMNNEIPRLKLSDYLDDLTRLKYNKDINNAYVIRDEKIQTGSINRDMKVMYVFGNSGTGKTTFAKWFAGRLKYSIFVSGSSNDPLQGYIGQECLILDDFRPSDWKFNDLLKMLDNNTNSMVKSRYSNKLLNDCKVIIITSTFNIDDCYKNLIENEQESKIQLSRRINMLVHVKENTCDLFEFDSTTNDFVLKEHIPNPVTMMQFVSDNEKFINDVVSMSKQYTEEYNQLVSNDLDKIKNNEPVCNDKLPF